MEGWVVEFALLIRRPLPRCPLLPFRAPPVILFSSFSVLNNLLSRRKWVFILRRGKPVFRSDPPTRTTALLILLRGRWGWRIGHMSRTTSWRGWKGFSTVHHGQHAFFNKAPLFGFPCENSFGFTSTTIAFALGLRLEFFVCGELRSGFDSFN